MVKKGRGPFLQLLLRRLSVVKVSEGSDRAGRVGGVFSVVRLARVEYLDFSPVISVVDYLLDRHLLLQAARLPDLLAKQHLRGHDLVLVLVAPLTVLHFDRLLRREHYDLLVCLPQLIIQSLDVGSLLPD